MEVAYATSFWPEMRKLLINEEDSATFEVKPLISGSEVCLLDRNLFEMEILLHLKYI